MGTAGNAFNTGRPGRGSAGGSLRLRAAAPVLRLLHDLGKVKPGFQAKLTGARNDVPHSGEGALVLHRAGALPAAWWGRLRGTTGVCPISSGCRIVLPPRNLLPCRNGVPSRKRWPRCSHWPEFCRIGTRSAYRLQFLIRMLYGCLTDAMIGKPQGSTTGLKTSPPIRGRMCW